MDAETFTLPEKPPRLVRVMVELSDGPATEDGLADMPKSGTALTGTRNATETSTPTSNRRRPRNLCVFKGSFRLALYCDPLGSAEARVSVALDSELLFVSRGLLRIRSRRCSTGGSYDHSIGSRCLR